MTGGALRGRGARLAHRAVAGVAQDVSVERDLLCGTEGGVLQGDVDGHLFVLAATHAGSRARSGGAEATAEHGFEDVGESTEAGARTRATTAQSIRTTDVVHLALLGIRERLVGDGQLLEGFLGVGSRVVGVKLTRELAVGLLNLVLAGVTGDTENLVVVSHGCSFFSWGMFINVCGPTLVAVLGGEIA